MYFSITPNPARPASTSCSSRLPEPGSKYNIGMASQQTSNTKRPTHQNKSKTLCGQLPVSSAGIRYRIDFLMVNVDKSALFVRIGRTQAKSLRTLQHTVPQLQASANLNEKISVRIVSGVFRIFYENWGNHFVMPGDQLSPWVNHETAVRAECGVADSVLMSQRQSHTLTLQIPDLRDVVSADCNNAFAFRIKRCVNDI